MKIELPTTLSKPVNRFEPHRRGFYKAYFKFDAHLVEFCKQVPGMRGGKDKSGYYWECPIEMAPRLTELVVTYTGRAPVFPEPRSVANALFHDLLHSYQQDFTRLVAAQGTGCAFFEAGLGKSAAALAARRDTTLVVCPAKVRGTWGDEILRWCGNSSVYIHKPGPKGWRYDGEEFIIVSYEMLAKVLDKLPSKVWSVIFDEMHYLKNYRSARTLAAEGFIKDHPEAVPLGLSATPAPDNLFDLYQPIHTITPFRLGKPSDFKARYFEVEHSKWTPGGIIRGLRHDTEEELRERIAGIGIRATKREYAHLMQPISCKVIHIEEHWTTEEAEASKRRLEQYHASESETILEQHNQATAAIKEEATIDYVKELIEEGHDHIAVLTWNREVAASLSESIRRLRGMEHEVVLVMGGMSDRDARIEKVSAAPKSIVVATMASIAEGINKLVVFDQVVLVQLYWSPVAVIQALGRFHRLTSKHPVTVHVMQLDGTLDEPIRKTLNKKITEISAVIKAGDGERVVGEMTVPEEYDWRADLRNAMED